MVAKLKGWGQGHMKKNMGEQEKKLSDKKKQNYERDRERLEDAQWLQREGMPAKIAAKVAKIPQCNLSRYGC